VAPVALVEKTHLSYTEDAMWIIEVLGSLAVLLALAGLGACCIVWMAEGIRKEVEDEWKRARREHRED
jgi:hypothetical protein